MAKVSSLTLAGLGGIEIVAGEFTGSVGLTADGIDSLSDAVVSLLVWLGLKLSLRAPDNRFHFGYYKVESLVAFGASIGLIAVGGFIIYRSYLAFIEPKPLTLPTLALVVLLLAGTISLYRALQMRKIAKKYNISSLRLDANNAIKDSAASFLVFTTVFASSLGFHFMDGIGGMAVGIFVLSVSYVVLKEASLVLLDAYHNPSLVDEVRQMASSWKGVEVTEILMRSGGAFIQSEIHLRVDGSMTVSELDKVKAGIESLMKERITGIQRVTISAKSRGDSHDSYPAG